MKSFLIFKTKKMSLKLSSTIAILTLISCANACKLFQGTRGWPLTYANTPDPQGLSKGTFYFEVDLPVTYNSRNPKSANPVYKFRPDIGLDQIYHGIQRPDLQPNPQDWGINCTGSDETNCAVTDPEASNFQSYYGYQFYWMPGTTHFSFDNEKPDVSKKPLPIQLINNPIDKSKWQFMNTGLWGLSPKSPFWTYIFDQYLPLKNNLGMNFYLNTDNSNYWYELYDGDYKDVYRGSELRISENIEDLLDFKETVQFAEAPDNGFWGIKGVKMWISSNMTEPIHQGDACISTTSPNYFISDKFVDLQNLVLNEICGSESCGKNDNILNAPNIIIEFETDQGTQKLTVTAEEYIYLSKGGQLTPSFDDMSTYQKDSCAINASFGFGRMFLFNRLVVMKMVTDAERTKMTPYVGVFDYSSRPSLAKPADVENMVWASFGLLLAVTIYVMVLRSGGSTDTKTVVKGQVSKVETEAPGDDDEEEKLDLAKDDQGGMMA